MQGSQRVMAGRFTSKILTIRILAVSAVALVILLASVSVAAQSVPSELTLQPGTVVSVRLNSTLSSDQNRSGDGFSATLDQPLVADGWVVARPGQSVMGRIATAQKAGRIKGVSQLGIELTELTAADGQIIPMRTQLLQSSGGTSHGQDAAVIGGTTGLGAALGAIAGGGKGAGIGAGAGAAAGIIGVLATPGRPTIIPAETLLTFRIEGPMTVSTARGADAFESISAYYQDEQRPQQQEPPRPQYRRQQYVPAQPTYYPPQVYVAPPPVYYTVPQVYYYPYYPSYYYRPYYYRPYYPGAAFVFNFGYRSHGHNYYGRHGYYYNHGNYWHRH